VLYLVLDPGLLLAESSLHSVVSFARRGESLHLLFSLTGRTELWEAIWEEFQASPWIGHGYFVTSAKGSIDVWSGPANRTAHNVLLQVLVTTGIVGTLLFTWGLLRPMMLLLPAFDRSRSQRAVVLFALPMGLWYLGWGQLCESFLGPIQPESVVFYSVLGMVVGTLVPSELPMQSRPARSAGSQRGRAVAT
jgi:O-antigen ligase